MASQAPQGRSPVEKSAQAFRTISEVAEDLDLPQHVLRFWETRFAQVRPMKRNGGRRLYRPGDIALLRGIRALLYVDGMTIKGVQKVLREQGIRSVTARGAAEETARPPAPPSAAETASRLAAIKQRLENDMPASEDPRETPAAPPSPATDTRRRRSLNADEGRRVRGSIARLEAILARLEAD